MRRFPVLFALAFAACSNGSPLGSHLSEGDASQVETANLTVAFAEGHEIAGGKIDFHKLIDFGGYGSKDSTHFRVVVEILGEKVFRPLTSYAKSLTYAFTYPGK